MNNKLYLIENEKTKEIMGMGYDLEMAKKILESVKANHKDEIFRIAIHTPNESSQIVENQVCKTEKEWQQTQENFINDLTRLLSGFIIKDVSVKIESIDKEEIICRVILGFDSFRLGYDRIRAQIFISRMSLPNKTYFINDNGYDVNALFDIAIGEIWINQDSFETLFKKLSKEDRQSKLYDLKHWQSYSNFMAKEEK